MTNKEENKELQTENSISIFKKDDTQKKFQELLGKRASWFLTTVMSIVAQNDMLRNADPNSVYLSALVSATLDLPINPNLGFAYILPYTSNVKTWTYDQQGKEIRVKKTVAQFQMWYKGFIQLAQRSWQFKTISACPVYEWQLIEENPLTGYIFDWKAKTSDVIIWYAGYFSLINGFEKTTYMTKSELEKHGKEYSQNYKKYWTWLWKDNFDAMATKTVLKLLLSKFAPLSVEMQTAVITDQGIIKNEEMEVEYIDNPPLSESTTEISEDKINYYKWLIDDCNTTLEVNELVTQNNWKDETILLYVQTKKDALAKI